MKVVFAAKCILLDWNAAAALQNDNLMGCFLSQKKYLYIFCLMSYILHFLCLRSVFNSRSILSFDILLLDMIHGHYRPTPRYMIQYPPLRHITDGYTAYQAEDLMDTCPEYHHGMARLYCVWGFLLSCISFHRAENCHQTILRSLFLWQPQTKGLSPSQHSLWVCGISRESRLAALRLWSEDEEYKLTTDHRCTRHQLSTTMIMTQRIET